MSNELTEDNLMQASVALDVLFTNPDLKDTLHEALEDESGLELMLSAVFAIEGADQWSEEELSRNVARIIEHQANNASHYLKKFFEYGANENRLLVGIKKAMGESRELQRAFTANECRELVRHLRTGNETLLSGVDRITGLYLLNKVLTPEMFE